MPMNPQPLMRTDTRLDLALDLKHNTTSPTTPRANGQPLFPLAGNVGHKRPLKRTESIGKRGTVDMFNPTAPTQGSLLSNKLPTYSQDTKSTSIPVFTHPHEDDDNVGLDFDTVGIARPDADSYGVGSYLDEARVPAKPEPTATPPTVPEIIPRIEMAIEGGGHLELWDAKPDLCARVNGCVSLSRKTMRVVVDGRPVEIVLRGIAVTASTAENPRRCENNHFDAAHPEWHVGGLSGGQQVSGRAVVFGNSTTGTVLGSGREFSVPFHIDIPMSLVQSRRDRIIVIGASAIFGSTHRPDVVRRIETEVVRLTLSNLQSGDVQIPIWR